MRQTMMTVFCLGLGLLLLGGCAKKEEEKIIITLQTEKVEEAQPAVSAPAETTSAELQETAEMPEKAVRDRPVETAPSRDSSSLKPVPPPVPRSLPSKHRPITDEERIMAIVRRQEVAFEEKNVSLYMADMITTTPKLEKSVERFFEKHEKIEVTFEPQDITVKDKTARVILQQSTHLVPKRGRPQDQRARILWGLTKVEGNWKINETKILEKY